MTFIVLSSLESVHDFVQYRYYIFFIVLSSLEGWVKTSKSLTFICTRERERVKYTVNAQCSVQYTLLLLNLMLVMSYCASFIN